MFNECSAAKRLAERQLRQQSEEYQRQVTDNKNLFGINTRLAQQIESAHAERRQQLEKLSNECQTLSAERDSLETEIDKLLRKLIETETKQLRLFEQLSRLTAERNASNDNLQRQAEEFNRQRQEAEARMAQARDECARMQREREAREDEHNKECARLQREREAREAEHNKQVSRLQKEHAEREATLERERDDKANTVMDYERSLMPSLLETANGCTDGILDRLHTIMVDLCAQRRHYQATADALRAGTIRPSPSIVVAIGQQAPPVTFEDDKSLSIVALPSFSATRQSPPKLQGDDHHELH